MTNPFAVSSRSGTPEDLKARSALPWDTRSVGCRLLAVNSWLLTIGSWVLAAGRLTVGLGWCGLVLLGATSRKGPTLLWTSHVHVMHQTGEAVPNE